MLEIALIILVVVYYALKWQIRRIPLGYYDGRHVVITGCDTGFGNLLASRLDSKGLTVFAGCLTETGAEELKRKSSPKLRTFPLDVTKEESVKKALEFVKSKLPKDTGLWCLVNNAGIAGNAGPVDWHRRSDYEKAMAVNLYGMIDMTNAFLPLLRKERGRVVNMTSMCGRITAAPSPYSTSKFAAEAFSDCLRRDEYHAGVTVHIIEPGYFRTNITNPTAIEKNIRNAFDRCSVDIQRYYGEVYVNESVDTAMKFLSTLTSKNTEDVIDAYTSAVCARFPRYRYVVGKDAKYFFRILWNLPESISDFILTWSRPTPAGLRKT